MAVITDQKTALAVMMSGENCFLSGVAGTGKTTLVKRFCKESQTCVSLTASTGIAALNIGGMTLHRFCGIGLGTKNGQSFEEFYAFLEQEPRFNNAKRRIRNCKILVIDEVSMLTGKTLDLVDYLFRRVRTSCAPFGGIQIIVVGDFLQLAPVKTKEEEDYDWVFESEAWKKGRFRNIYLQKIWRQQSPKFIQCLNDFRIGRLSYESGRLLRGRVIDFPDENITRLFTHNVQVEKWNRYKLDQLPDEDVIYAAQCQGSPHQIEFLKNNLVTPEILTLREGARVMITANMDADGVRLVNGQIGWVKELEENHIVVRLEHDNAIVQLDRYSWQYDWQDSSSAKFSQFPLRLAYALTIHKSQGLTLDQAFIDIRAAREPGQAYVALSRVRELRGVFLKAWFKGFFVSQRAIEFYRRLS